MDQETVRKDRILVLLSRVPYPLNKGDKLRAWHQLKTLCKEFEVFLICLNDNGKATKEQLKALELLSCQVEIINLKKWQIWVQLVRAIFSSEPFQVKYFYQKHASKKVTSIIEDFLPKHIYCQLVRTAKYVEHFGVIPSTLDYMDALSAGMKRRYKESKKIYRHLYRIEAKRLHQYEHQCFSSFNNKTIITKNDLNLIDHPDHNEIKVIANGVDTSFFKPSRNVIAQTVLFTGNMSYPPNVKAAIFLVKEVMPLLWNNYPNANLILAGASPHYSLKSLANNRVVVTGWVDDIKVYYEKAHVFVAPMSIGTGLQNKLLEAMAMEVPIVTTTLANEALKAKNDYEVLIANDAAEINDKIGQIFENPDLASNLSCKAHAFVLSKYSWQSNNKMLVDLLRN